MFISELKQLQLKSETISIERDCSDDELTGHLCLASEDVVAMHLYTNEGEYDGFTIFETDQIEEVFWGNREHRTIASLIKKAKPVRTPELRAVEFQDLIVELDSRFESMCFYAGKGEEYFDIGKIEKHDEEWLKVTAFGTKKTLSVMNKLISRDAITRVTVNSPYQNTLVDLHESEF